MSQGAQMALRQEARRQHFSIVLPSDAHHHIRAAARSLRAPVEVIVDLALRDWADRNQAYNGRAKQPPFAGVHVAGRKKATSKRAAELSRRPIKGEKVFA